MGVQFHFYLLQSMIFCSKLHVLLHLEQTCSCLSNEPGVRKPFVSLNISGWLPTVTLTPQYKWYSLATHRYKFIVIFIPADVSGSLAVSKAVVRH